MRDMRIVVRRVLVLTFAVGLTACGDVPSNDNPVTGAGQPEALEDLQSPLLGSLVIRTGCTSRETTMATMAHEMARVIAVSKSFAQCVDAAMRHGIDSIQGEFPHFMGPYDPYPSDPYESSSLDVQIDRAIKAATNTVNIELWCDGTGSGYAEAHHGEYSSTRQAAEQILAHGGFRGLADRDNLRNTTLADRYHPVRATAANVLWHEAMHQWGYRHEAGAIQTEAMYKTVPFIVGSCMEKTMVESRDCSQSCAAMAWPVRDLYELGGTRACRCVDDPQYDVGVVLDSTATCPVPPNRYAAREMAIFMDDEDDDNNSRSSGWIGQLATGTNTRFEFCAVPGGKFRQPTYSKFAFAAARMGATCPSNSVSFSRYFDNEDTDNINSTSGQVRPSSVTANTRLEFCMFVPGAASSVFPFPLFGASYGVFAPADTPGALATGYIVTDDEDNSNSNSLSGDHTGSDVFLTATANTTLRLVKVR